MDSDLTTIDLHLHTSHSFDCESRITDILRWAERKGIQVIALTDHDMTTAYREAERIQSDVQVIPGVEVTTSKGTHLLGYFVTEPIQSRDILDVIDEIHDRGGICSLPHPYRSDTGLLYNYEIKRLHSAKEVEKVLERVDLLEALNAKCSDIDRTRTDMFIAEHTGKAVTAGSDGHQAFEVGRAHLALADVRSYSDGDLKDALLNNDRIVRHETGVTADGLENATLGVIETLRGVMKRVKRLAPDPVWQALRSGYLRSREAIGGRTTARTFNEASFREYIPSHASEKPVRETVL